MEIYNSITKKKEEFKSINQDTILIYICGVTVYGPIHIGHARTFVAYDIIRRYFEIFKEKKVIFIQNITDVGHIMGDGDDGDDKIEHAAILANKHPMQIVDESIKTMWDGLDLIRCKRPTISPRATGHIVEIIDATKKLIEKGFAYESDGDVYYDIEKFAKYGILSNNTIKNLMDGARIEIDDKKRNPFDFALWKKATPEHIMQWNSPWGKGYPGWHIECSVMSNKYLGKKFDIHGGARELSFPHHENEIAQSYALYGCQPANYWVHTGVLNIDGQKMAKSLGNFITVEKLLEEIAPSDLRYFIASSKYSANVNFSKKAIDSTCKSLKRIEGFIDSLDNKKSNVFNDAYNLLIEKFKENFEKEMDNDFNTPGALASIFDFIKGANKLLLESSIDEKNIEDTMHLMNKINNVFDAFDFLKEKSNFKEVLISEKEILKLIEQRDFFRKKKQWNEADKIKNQLLDFGIELVDAKEGTTYKYIN